MPPEPQLEVLVLGSSSRTRPRPGPRPSGCTRRSDPATTSPREPLPGNLLYVLDRAPGTGRAVVGLRLALAMYTPWLIRGWYAEAARSRPPSRRAHGDRDRAGALVAETGVAYTRTGFAWPRYATRTTAVRDALTD